MAVSEEPAPTKQSPREDTFTTPDPARLEALLAQPATPAGRRTLAALIEDLARTDPNRALALAKADPNLKQGATLVLAALRGWAKTDPARASAYALSLADPGDREAALDQVFTGAAATRPQGAVTLAQELIRNHPAEAIGYGARLIDALALAGDFERAARFAGQGDAETRAIWLSGAYSRWSEFQPELAARDALTLADTELRDQALQGIVAGWSRADPKALVHFASRLPPAAGKNVVLGQALANWARQDPVAASEWIDQRESGPEFDQGVATVAVMPSVKPDVAAGWAESVTDPRLRSETLATVLRNWLSSDPGASLRYFEASRDLTAEDREQLAQVYAGLRQP